MINAFHSLTVQTQPQNEAEVDILIWHIPYFLFTPLFAVFPPFSVSILHLNWSPVPFSFPLILSFSSPSIITVALFIKNLLIWTYYIKRRPSATGLTELN